MGLEPPRAEAQRTLGRGPRRATGAPSGAAAPPPNPAANPNLPTNSATEPNEEYHQNLIEVALERVKRQVDPKAFQIYDCYVVKQWTVEEVMRTLEVSRHQVYNAKSRISKLLRKTIEQLETKML